MAPDETNMTFSAYVPKDLGKSAAAISFARYEYETITTDPTPANHTIQKCWDANMRYNHTTFYPVSLTGTYTDESSLGYYAAGNDHTKGYWNVSVLVDGTYENLIYQSLTDGAAVANGGDHYFESAEITTRDGLEAAYSQYDRKNYGKLEYSYNGETWNVIANDLSDTMTNNIDRYRFYAPAENYDTVYWRWTPYAGYTITITDPDPDAENEPAEIISAEDTKFEYTHDLTTGIYKLVTEAQDNVIYDDNAQQEQATAAPQNGLLSSGRRVIQTEAPTDEETTGSEDENSDDTEETSADEDASGDGTDAEPETEPDESYYDENDAADTGE